MDSGEEPLDRLEDEAFTDIANELLEKCNLPGRVSRIEECRDNFFIGVYKGLLGDDLPGITDNPVTVDQRIKNCQTLIDLVAAEVLSVDLSHISGKSIVEGDRISIRNLLEIFAGLLEFFMECVDDQADHDSKDSDDEDDSNLLTSEHDVISGVLREELGPSYNDINVPRFRPSGISEPSQKSERASKQPINQRHLLRMATQDSLENKQTRKPNTESMTWNGSSTGFDADTSKMSDSRADLVSDSTAELIRLGETSTDRSSRAAAVRKETSGFHPDSQSYASTSLGPSISEKYDSFSGGIVSGSLNGSRSKDVSGRGVSRVGDTVRTDRVVVREPDSSQASHSVGRRRDCPSAEVDLTQYSLTSTELREVSQRQGGKEPGKPSSSFLSASSVSASWPDQISPLEPTKSSASGGSGGFEALGVRPREQQAAAEGMDTGSGGSSGRSSPVYHHYHHHFHHTQPQPGGPGFQSVAGVSATTAVDAPDPRSSLSRHGPPAAPTAGTDRALGVRTGPTTGGRLLQTAPGALTQPPTAAPGGATGYPPPATGVRTASTLTDSVFLPASGSTGPPLVRTATSGVRSDGVSVTSSLRERLARPLTTTTASAAADTSLPMSKTVPSTSFRGQGTLGSSLHDRTPRTVQADRWIDRLDTLPREQPLASTFPGRPSVGEVPRSRPTDIHPPSVRRTKAAELLAKYTRPEAGESEESESEREDEDEDLAQNSDSAVDYGRSEPVATASRMKSVSLAKHRTEKDTKSPRPRRAYRAESTEDDSSPDPHPRRGVTFRDTVETFPVTGRMDRLRRLLYEEATEQRKHRTHVIRKGYRDQLREIQQDKEKEKRRQPKRRMLLSPNLTKKKPKKKFTMKQGGKLEKVYCSQDRRSRPTKKTTATTTTTTKGRKRSASASPVLSRRREGHPDALLPGMLEEFPFLHVSPQTAHSMWRKQAHHLSSVLKSGTEAKKTKTQRMIEEAEHRQETLVGILKKDLDHNLRMREKQDRQQQQQTVKAKLRDKRQISARARRYYDDYELRMRARMLKRRTREEQIFKRLFQDGLELQKQRIRELRDYAKEKREAQAQRQQNEIESLENFYRDQFAMLGEGIARERYEMEVREKAQDKVVRQMRRELRQKLEHDVQEFQGNLQRDEDSAYFRQLEADRLRKEFQLATRSAFY